MATIMKNWAASATQIEGTGDGYTTLSGSTEEFSSSVNMFTNGYEGAHVTVEIDYDASPTDEVIVRLYGSLDNTNWDATPIWEIQGDNSVDTQQLSFIVKDLAYFRLGFEQTPGTTDSHNVRAYVREWNYSSS